MFTIYEPDRQKWPIKVWLESPAQLEAGCREQAMHLANLPFLHRWVALMPDTHSGFGMPIGGVIATEEVIIPNAVGVDIGCGMVFVQTDLPVELLQRVETPNGKLGQAMVGDILRSIPTGSEHHQIRHDCTAAQEFSQALREQPPSLVSQCLLPELERACFQVGTLGSGNHFIELQTDDAGRLGIMVHSGSRNVGYTICNYFNGLARRLNQEIKSPIPPEWDLAYLPLDTEIGREYIRWMDFALAFARENREQMLSQVITIVQSLAEKHAGVKKITLSERVNCHHNYAARETHDGRQVWVHRKGAIRAGRGEMGIIPGAMGSFSYLVRGLGNPESFLSCSHGAGRLMSRHEAKQRFSVQDTVSDLKKLGVFLGKVRRRDVAEESRHAYKNIDEVIANELDLVEPVSRLHTVAVVKG